MQKLYQKHGEDTLDVVFAPERWQPSPTIIRVVNPEDLKSRRFVLVWNSKAQDHKNCPFYHHVKNSEMMGKTDGAIPAKEFVLEHHEGEPEMDKVFVPWEEREARDCDPYMMQKLFVKRQTAPKKAPKKKIEKKKSQKMKYPKEQTDKKRQKGKKSKKNTGNAKKRLYLCDVDVCEKIQKVLTRTSYKLMKPKLADKRKPSERTPSSARQQGRVGRTISSEPMLPRKIAMKKQREEKMMLKEVDKVVDGLLDVVVLCVVSREKVLPR